MPTSISFAQDTAHCPSLFLSRANAHAIARRTQRTCCSNAGSGVGAEECGEGSLWSYVGIDILISSLHDKLSREYQSYRPVSATGYGFGNLFSPVILPGDTFHTDHRVHGCVRNST
eukprot:1957623-Rhodomonas_salina.1